MIKLIVAVNSQGIIGFNGGLPWHHPEDLKRFKRLTENSTLVMGRKTYQSLGYASTVSILADRDIVVITRDEGLSFTYGGCVRTCRWLSEAIERLSADNTRTTWICGGSLIYAEALAAGYVDEMHVTFVPDVLPDRNGYAYFPVPVDGERRELDVKGPRWVEARDRYVESKMLIHRVYVRAPVDVVLETAIEQRERLARMPHGSRVYVRCESCQKAGVQTTGGAYGYSNEVLCYRCDTARADS